MANIFKRPQYSAANGYNGFDMSNRLKFSSTVGELLPVYYDLLQPGDKVSMKTILKSRTMELASAAMCNLTEHLEWYFVPMEQIFTPFGSWFFGVHDMNSIYYELLDAEYLPYFSPTKVLDFFYANATNELSDAVFPENSGSRYRLLEFLDIPYQDYQDARSESNVVGWCPIFACAYQKIYHDYYQDTDREEISPVYWNLDHASNVPATALTWTNFLQFTTLRYRSWKKDFYTSIFPSPLFGFSGVNAVGQVVMDTFRQWLTSVNVDTFNNPGWTSISSSSGAPSPVGRGEMSPDNTSPSQLAPSGILTPSDSITTSYTQYGNLQQALSPTSIRTSFAVQKYLEVCRRAGKTYDAQQLAHFGVSLPLAIAGKCFSLGDEKTDLFIGDVIATGTGTAGDATSVLGQVGGKGYAHGQSRDIKFTAPCHGILMCLFSVEPDVDYYGQCQDKLQNLTHRADWFSPEYDNLGMQPLFNYQAKVFDSSDTGWLPSGILGWQYRYSELKTKYNRVRGSLRRTLNYWTTARNYMTNSLWSFKVNPAFLNSIMLDSYRGLSVADVQEKKFFEHDPLIHELYFDVKKSSKMSTYGLESL